MPPAYYHAISDSGEDQLERRGKLTEWSRARRQLRSKSESWTAFKTESSASLSAQAARRELLLSRERLLRTQSDPHRPSFIFRMSGQQIMVLASLILSEFLSFCSMSVMAPFFPKEASLKGLSPTVSGFVFSFYAFVIFVTSPLFGKLLPKIGAKYLFSGGMFLAGGCNVLFGLLPQIDGYMQFTAFSFIIRGLEAIGASAYATASFVFVVEIFPHNISAVIGMLETAMGLGMSVGPAIGGLLYSLGGFGLPFFTLGALLVVLVPTTWFMLPIISDSKSNEDSASFTKLFKIPAVSVVGLIIVVASNTWAFLDPTLEPHLSRENLSGYHIGLIFLLFAALYGVFSPIWGYVSDRLDNHWSMMVIGLLMSSVGLLMLGPTPLLDLPPTLWMDITGLCIIGISVALTLMPTFKGILNCAEESGFRQELTTYSLVAGAWSCMYSIGDMTGPALGGVIMEHFGFPMCATAMAAVSIITALIATVFFTSRCSQPVDGEEEDEEARAHVPLLLSDTEDLAKRNMFKTAMTFNSIS